MTSTTSERRGWTALFPDFRIVGDTLCEVDDDECRPVDDSKIRARLCRIFRLDSVDDAEFINDGVAAVMDLLRDHEELVQDFASEREGNLAVRYCLGITIPGDGRRRWMERMNADQLARFGLLDWCVKRSVEAWSNYLNEVGLEEKEEL